MILEITQYGHPALRQPGRRIEAVNDEVRQLAADMIETMHQAEGIGLAAQQVGRALQLFVVDVGPVKDRPSTLEISGQAVDPASAMPLVLINPEITPSGPSVVGAEGCLSFPEVYGEILRPEAVEVKAVNQHGEPVAFKCGGLLSRAVQHEHDHLRGILFIDRMTDHVRQQLQPELDRLMAATKARLGRAR
jgi:peptide deformylase